MMRKTKKFKPGNMVKTLGVSYYGLLPRGTEAKIIELNRYGDPLARIACGENVDWIDFKKLEMIPRIHQETGIDIDELYDEIMEASIGLHPYRVFDSYSGELGGRHFSELEEQILPRHVRRPESHFEDQLYSSEIQGFIISTDVANVAGMTLDERARYLTIHSLSVLPGFNDYSVVQERLLQFAMSNAYFEGRFAVKMGVWQYHPILGVADTLGFEQVGQNENYYRTGENQLLLEKVLEKEEVMGFLDNLRGKNDER